MPLKNHASSGLDERHGNTLSSEETEQMSRIHANFKKMELLKILQSSKNSDTQKVTWLEKPSIAPNITQGGLYKDWNFVF